MSLARNLFPLVTVTAVGISSGVYIFQPLIKAQKDAQRESAAADANASDPSIISSPSDIPVTASSDPRGTDPATASPSEVLRQTEINVANAGGATRIPSETPRFAMVGNGFIEDTGGARGFEWGR